MEVVDTDAVVVLVVAGDNVVCCDVFRFVVGFSVVDSFVAVADVVVFDVVVVFVVDVVVIVVVAFMHL